MTNYIALAIPFFFLLMGVEIAWARRRGVRLYRFNDSLVDLSCGMAQQILVVFGVGLLSAAYVWMYRHRLFEPGAPWSWLIAFVAVDFTYYVWHRMSHRVNFLWAVHVVHHQSEDFNLAVALRQAVLSPWTILPFHLPLALAGVPPVVFATVESFSTLYQFWIHTELVGKLGIFEWIFNTPSQHRVHHAVNPRYLDKNYAATLCIWDRMFGTFEPEREEPVYGLVKPLRSFNPIRAQLQGFVDIATLSAGARGGDRVRAVFEDPAWRPGGPLEAPEVTRATARKYDPRPSPGVFAYLSANLMVAVIGTTALLFTEFTLDLPRQAALAFLLLLTLLGFGGLVERRRWAVPLELARLVLAAATALFWLHADPRLAAAAALCALPFAAWIFSLRRQAAPAA
jgi:sterol desaturase/sphingolipid hydroxylase (fatty acid hydroxylase superfamily)